MLLSAGLQKWRRNLQLLVPFLEDPQIQLFSLENLGTRSEQPAVLLKVAILPQDVGSRLPVYLSTIPWNPMLL